MPPLLSLDLSTLIATLLALMVLLSLLSASLKVVKEYELSLIHI